MQINPIGINRAKFPDWLWENKDAPGKTEEIQNPVDQVDLDSSKPPARSGGVAVSGTGQGVGQQITDSMNPPGAPRKKWTILFYSAADNDLEQYMIRDANDIENASISNDMNVLLQLDRGEKPSDVSGGWKGARRMVVKKDNDLENLGSPVVEDMGQVNMSAPESMSDFIKWGMKNYPAQNYMLIISDHGAGWKGGVQDKSHKDWMSIPEMREALTDAEKETGKKLDVLGFDACLMGQTEVAYELKDHASYMVASEDLEGAEGWPYHNILPGNTIDLVRQAMLMKINMTPEKMAKFLVHSSAQDKQNLPTMSAVDMKKMKGVAEATDKFAKAIIESDTPHSDFFTLIRQTQPFEGFKDHYDFAQKVYTSKQIKDPKLKDAAMGVMKSLKEAVLMEQHNEKMHPNAHGLTIHLPSFRMSPPEDYRQTLFAQDTNWDEALDHMDSFAINQQVPPGFDQGGQLQFNFPGTYKPGTALPKPDPKPLGLPKPDDKEK